MNITSYVEEQITSLEYYTTCGAQHARRYGLNLLACIIRSYDEGCEARATGRPLSLTCIRLRIRLPLKSNDNREIFYAKSQLLRPPSGYPCAVS